VALSSNVWNVPSAWPALSGGETHVWAINVEASTPRVEELKQLLSADEIIRADRFHFERDRLRFIAARGQLRIILGRYAKCAPQSLQFAYSPFGKPSLAPPVEMRGLRFNASRSDGLALVALRLDVEVGIDVEQLRSLPDALALSKRMLTTREQEALTSLPEELRETRFLEYWARKEAVVKALGKGLWQSFDRFSLHPWPGMGAQRVSIEHGGTTVTQWVMPIAAPREGFVAAMATAEPIGTVRCWTFGALTKD
jgi:4'-phosphopantetheinyl transferase